MLQFKKNKKLEKKEIDIISNILYTYIKELKDDLIKKISDTITNNFIIYKQKMINRKLKSVYYIYKAKEKLNLNQKFSQQNQILFKENSINKNNNNNSNNFFNLNLNVGPIINNNNNNTNISSNDNKSKENNEEKKAINKHINNNSINIINSLYNSNSYPNKSKIALNAKNKKRPLSSDESNKNKNNNNLSLCKNFEEKVLLNKMHRNKNSTEKIDKFIKRQEIFSKNNFHKKEKIIKDNEDENKLIYTFEPKINDSLRKLYKNDNISVEKRLYNDSVIRRNKKLEKEYDISNKSKNTNKKQYNQKKIIELYEEYNLRKEKNEKLIKKIEKECGYTYVPNVLHKKNKSCISGNKVQNNKSKNKKNDKNNINNNTNNTNINKNISKKKLKKNHSFTNQSLIKKINE